MPCDDADDIFQQCSDDGFESNLNSRLGRCVGKERLLQRASQKLNLFITEGKDFGRQIVL